MSQRNRSIEGEEEEEAPASAFPTHVSYFLPYGCISHVQIWVPHYLFFGNSSIQSFSHHLFFASLNSLILVVMLEFTYWNFLLEKIKKSEIQSLNTFNVRPRVMSHNQDAEIYQPGIWLSDL